MTYSKGKNPNSRNGFKRKYEHNESFFESYNKKSCYRGGFIAADGNVSDKGKLTIGLKLEDKNHINKFIDDIGYTGVIGEGISKSKFPYTYVSISSRSLCSQLNDKFNISPRKSLTYIPPQIEGDENRLSFIKGYIDGDGCIGVYRFKNKVSERMKIDILGTNDMCKYIDNTICSILGVKGNIYKYGNIYKISYQDSRARKLFLLLYNIEIGLDRKWNNRFYEHCKSRNKRYNISLYGYVYNMLKEISVGELAKRLGCTTSNIYILKKSRNYLYFLEHETKILDEGVIDMESSES